MPIAGGSASPDDISAVLALGVRVDVFSRWALPTVSVLSLMLLLHGIRPGVGKLLLQRASPLKSSSKNTRTHFKRKLVWTRQ